VNTRTPSSSSSFLLLGRGFFSTNPSLEFIEVEENSSDDDEAETNGGIDSVGLPEESDPNIDAVVQSFLDVVGKCSEITQQVCPPLLNSSS
jgi:hypothetical protein